MENDITNELTIQLKQYIKKSGHVETGYLLQNSKIIKKGEKFFISAPIYIKFLEDGDFITNFFNLPVVRKLISEYVAETVSIEIRNAFKK